MDAWIEKWKSELGIQDWAISVSPINPDDSVDYNDQDYFIGIEKDHGVKKAVIYHDIPLCEEAVVHELLHVRYPEAHFPGKSFDEYENIITRAAKALLQPGPDEASKT